MFSSLKEDFCDRLHSYSCWRKCFQGQSVHPKDGNSRSPGLHVVWGWYRWKYSSGKTQVILHIFYLCRIKIFGTLPGIPLGQNKKFGVIPSSISDPAKHILEKPTDSFTWKGLTQWPKINIQIIDSIISLGQFLIKSVVLIIAY